MLTLVQSTWAPLLAACHRFLKKRRKKSQVENVFFEKDVHSEETTSNVCLCLFLSVFMEQYPTEEDMIEWAKRESEREEKERLARLTQQEQEDLELAIALSKSELS